VGVLKDGINAIESGSYTLRKYIHAGFQMGKQSSCSSTAAIVEALKLQEGDHIEITIAGEREFKVGPRFNPGERIEAPAQLEMGPSSWIQIRSG
jgi:hypothetical protein